MRTLRPLLLSALALLCTAPTIIVHGPVLAPSGAAAPVYGGEITATRMSETGSASTTAKATNRTCAVGEHIIVFIYAQDGTEDVSGVADDAGNTYTSRVTTFLSATGDRLRCFSAPVTTQLTSGANITITWSNPSYTYRGALYCYATNIGATPIDNTATGNASFGTSCASATVTTTAANTLVFEWLCSSNAGNTYSGGSFTNIGASVDFGPSTNRTNVFLQSAFTSSGAKSSGGSWGTNTNTGYLLVALK